MAKWQMIDRQIIATDRAMQRKVRIFNQAKSHLKANITSPYSKDIKSSLRLSLKKQKQNIDERVLYQASRMKMFHIQI